MPKGLLLKALNKVFYQNSNNEVLIFTLNLQEELVFYYGEREEEAMLIAIVHNGYEKVSVFNWLTIDKYVDICKELYPGYEIDVKFEPSGLCLVNWDGSNCYGGKDLYEMKTDENMDVYHKSIFGDARFPNADNQNWFVSKIAEIKKYKRVNVEDIDRLIQYVEYLYGDKIK
jgi:hypothetical protein